jgi:predicted lipid-binding transport protein (Tim44 family)
MNGMMGMKGIQQALCGLILAITIPCLVHSQTSQSNQTQEVEYASSPAAAPETNRATPAPRPATRLNSQRSAKTPAPTVVQEEASAPPPVSEPELPAWRISAKKILTPLGINTFLTRIGMSGPTVDILGYILLFILSVLSLLVAAILFQVIRNKIADKIHHKQMAALSPKTEPRMRANRLKQNTHGSANSRHQQDTKVGGSRLQTDASGPAGRLEMLDTRNGPASRLGMQDTRNGPASRLGLETRGGLPSLLGSNTMGVNPVLHKMDVQNAPPDFDQARFLRKARVYFLRLQLAWDKSDLNSIRQFAAGPVFNELRKQILERGETPNCTDVLSIQTQLLGIEITDGHYLASVKFNGMIKETMELAEAPFEETWHLSMPTDKKGDWVLSGIAQSL